jgi:hypothetical protein
LSGGSLPLEVVPSFMNVLVHGEEISVSCSIHGALEYGVVDHTILVEILQEVFDLRNHTNVAILELQTEVRGQACVSWINQHLVIKGQFEVSGGSEILLSFQVLRFGHDAIVLVRVDGRDSWHLALGLCRGGCRFIEDTLLIADRDVVLCLVLLDDGCKTIGGDSVCALSSKGALQAGET